MKKNPILALAGIIIPSKSKAGNINLQKDKAKE